jgi:hypothetical protein
VWEAVKSLDVKNLGKSCLTNHQDQGDQKYEKSQSYDANAPEVFDNVMVFFGKVDLLG